VKYDAAKIRSLEMWILKGQDIVVECPERRLWSAPHSFIKRINNPVLEIIASWISSDDCVPLIVGDAFVSATGEIHSRPNLHQTYLRMHVLGNAWRGMQSDRVPDSLDVRFRNGVTP
jgi:hypothetical protein